MSGLVYDKNDNARQGKRYLRQSVWLTAGLTLVGLLVMTVFRKDSLLAPIVVSAVFSVVIETADSVVWRKVANRNPDGLTSFYTAVSGFRMLLALATMLIYYIVVGSDGMLEFFLVFMSFYVVMLIHHATFFARISNRS